MVFGEGESFFKQGMKRGGEGNGTFNGFVLSILNYVYYTGKTEAELQAILNRVLATNTWISTDPYQMDGSCIFPSVSVMLGEFCYLITVGL